VIRWSGRTAAVLVAWLLLLAAAGLQIARTPFNADLSAFLPAAPDARQRMLTEQLQSGRAARTILVGLVGGQAEARLAASRALAAALRETGLFEQVNNGDRAALADLGRWVLDRRYLLSPAVDARHFSPDGLRDAIDDSLSLLGTPAGAAVKALLDRDPTGEAQRIAEVGLSGGGPRLADGLWVSHDGERALLMLVTRAEGADLDAQARAIAAVQAAAQKAAPGLTLQMTGGPIFSVDSRTHIEEEVRTLAISGSLLIGLLLLAAFGSLLALGAVALPVLTGVVVGIAAVGLGFGSVHGITLGFGVTLIGEAVDYAIYYLIQARAAAPDGWRHWLRNGWPTVRLGLLTSVFGFAALAVSGFPGLAQLGVFSMTGLVAAALTTRTVLPVLMPDGSAGRGLRHGLGRTARHGLSVLPRLRHGLTALGLAAVALLLWQHDHIWEAELSSLSPVPASQLALDESLRNDLSAGDSGALVVIQAPDAQTALERAEAAGTRLDTLVAEGRLRGYDSVTRLLPSLATQARRRAALPDADTLRLSLAEATAGGPLPVGRLAPFVADVQAARASPPITPESAREGPARALVDALLVQARSGGWMALIALHGTDDSVDVAAAERALGDLPDAHVVQIGEELRGLYRHYLHEAQTQALAGGAAVLLLMALWLRSPRRLLGVCVPLVLAVALVMGGLRVAGVPLGILHLVGLLLVVAVGSNYALFFDLLHEQGAVDDDTLASLLLANGTTVLSFGLIALSSIPALSAIGTVVAPGALLALLASAAYARPGRRRAADPAGAV